MREGTTRVKEVLGFDFPATDKEIQDSLWHYYYDVEKSVSYLLSKTFSNTLLSKYVD